VSQKQMQRMKVVASATEGRTSVAEAAELWGVSARQVKRLKREYDAEDAGWVQHNNQGRRPANALSDACILALRQLDHLLPDASDPEPGERAANSARGWFAVAAEAAGAEVSGAAGAAGAGRDAAAN